ncbi:unnamed protein product [Calicophoron daubneyi]|uniref:Homeobox domain-containing protein n=1 Tax=Calicophoron daubneyi TaxID=300641 RepID=A0AAV2TRI8_CALDB
MDKHGSIDASEISCINRGAQIAKRRKTRTTFSNSQLIELENNFNRQKYLTPSDRDRIAKHLGLTNTQVITWFQNRRAKLKREAEELERDILAARQQEHRKLFEISSGPEFGEKRVRSEDVICSDQTDFSDEWKITHPNGPSSEVASSPDMNSVLSIHRLVGDRSPKPPKLALLNGELDKQKPTKPQANLLWSPAEEIDEKWRKSGE